MEKTTRLKRDLAYTGTILKIYRDTVVANGIEEEYDYIHHDGAAAVLPVTKDGKILMVRQYRNALDRFTLEIPAGKLDAPDEPKIECAARELEEETGFRSETLEFLYAHREEPLSRDLLPLRRTDSAVRSLRRVMQTLRRIKS